MSTTDACAPTPSGAPLRPLSKGLAVAALCVGIVAFLTGLVPVLGLLLGAAAVVLGVLSLRAVRAGRGGGGRMGMVGLVLGAIAALTNIVVLLLAAIGLAAGGGASTASATPDPAATASPDAETPSAEPPAATEEAPAPEPSASEPASPEPTPSALPGVGVPVTTEDGAQYTLTNFACGIAQVGSEFLNATAQGEYCQADLTLVNTGKKSVSFNSSDVRAFAGDVEYEVDSEASLYADEGNAFLEDVNPGNTLQSKVFFDVPAGTRLERMEVGGGLFSDGENIQLP